MADVPDLKAIEQQTLAAIIRLNPNAYGVSIRDEIKERINIEYSFGSIYAVLERLEDGGLIEFGKEKRRPYAAAAASFISQLPELGEKALQASFNAVDAMRSGLKLKGALA